MTAVLRLALVGVLSTCGLALASSPATAGCRWATETVERAGLLVTQTVKKCSHDSLGESASEQDPESPENAKCLSQALKGQADPFTSCPGGARNHAATPLIGNDSVLRAIRRTELPASLLVIQPPGGKTLVNFDTIFSTEEQPFERTVRPLGHEVVLRIRPSSFNWRFGDGSEPLRTTEPGRTYQRGLPMDSYITHQYEHADVTVHPRVDTTYSAEYSVDGQPFQPVIGTVTIDGVPATLRVVEARPVLTGTR
jgi:hypothetical protein